MSPWSKLNLGGRVLLVFCIINVWTSLVLALEGEDVKDVLETGLDEDAIDATPTKEKIDNPDGRYNADDTALLEQLEKDKYFPDLVFHLEETFPFRQEGLLDGMIINLLEHLILLLIMML